MDQERKPTEEKQQQAEGPATDFQRWTGDRDTMDREMFEQALSAMDVYNSWDEDDSDTIGQGEFTKRVFAIWNDNDDDHLTEQEWSETHSTWYRQEQKHGTFDDWDADGDGELTQREVGDGIEQSKLFGFWDHDGNDEIDEKEFYDHAFNVWDRDDNDAIDESEWNESIEQWQVGEKEQVVTL